MATELIEQLKISGAYVDNLLGPYADLSALADIASSDRFIGLTVTVLAPVQMDVWLTSRYNSGWRIKAIRPLATFADLTTATETIMASIPRMIEVGTEATVIADETNGGKPTKYWATAVDTTAKTVTWEKMGGNVDLTGYATEQWVEDKDYLPKDSIQGNDKE